MNAVVKMTLRILCGAVAGALLGYQVAAEPVPELVALNERMIAVVRSDATRRDHSGGQVPGEVQSAISTLRSNGIPIFNTLPELASATDLRDAIIQEYYRMQGDWGMPWLPLSWSVQGLHSEAVVSELESAIRAQFERAPLPMSDDQLFLLYLYSGSIFHTTRGTDHINDLRGKAENLAQTDRSFYDIRLEIHQEPSLATIRRVREWIANLPSSSRGRRGQAEEILQILEDLFGNADIETYLRLNPVDRTSYDALTSAAARIVAVRDASGSAGMEAVLPGMLADVETLAARARAVSDEVRALPGACGSGTSVPACKHLKMDLVKQLTRAQFVIGNAFIQKAGEVGLQLSLDTVLRLSKAFVVASAATGIMQQGAIAAVEAADQAVRRAAAAGQVPLATIQDAFSGIEQLASEAYRRARGLFAAQLDKYGRFVPQADRFIDDMMRASNLLPLSNLTASVVPAIQELSGARLRIDGALVAGGHRVLNPGIGRGRLVILDEASLMNEEYSWNPDFIYVLTKTPAWLQKVAGIITCDSGSMISHVQLLASNHGLPNVKISCSILSRLEALANREILLISLPNGEVRITPVSSASAEEVRVHAEYTNARARLKVRLPRPSRLDINYPVRLEQLRMDDSGKVAGGKACGQGELAAVFPDRVPRAIVLPFGVYYDHVVRTGIYEEIQRTLGDPTLRGHEREVVDRRKAALARIRERIQNIQLLPETEEFLLRVLMAEPFRGRGVFVRSDTNAEDLPGFVGAGLNETVPNVVGVANIIQAVKRVWASPFREKAFTWRDDLIENPWDIFPSIVIQLAINSDKAGIMVVGDPLEDDLDDHVFLAANEGLGITAVNGEYMPEELVYSRRESRVIRLRQAYAPERKRLLPAGGITSVPVLGLNPILTDAEAAGFAEIGDTIQDHLYRTYGDREKWDLEWGVAEGRLVLFQIRTFVGNKVARNVTALRRLETDVRGGARAGVAIGDPVIGIISATAR